MSLRPAITRLAALFVPFVPFARACRTGGGALAIAIGVAAALASGSGHAAPAVQVEVIGQGRPVLMIPGLASGAEVWKETCAALQPGVACHLVQLAGFAGAPKLAEDGPFLARMRDALLAHLDRQGLRQVDVMGHSLGGNLALMLAAQAPQRVGKLVIVDSLPFLAGIRNPDATAEQAQQMAEGMRAGLQAGQQATPEQRAAGQRRMAQGMTRSEPGQDTIVRWGQASDAATVTQAMVELYGQDFRPLLARLPQPTLVLGSWAAYERMGSTLASTQALFERQYASLPQHRVAMSEKGYHFLMWDDREWLVAQVQRFLAE